MAKHTLHARNCLKKFTGNHHQNSHPPNSAHIGAIKVAAELKHRAVATMENPSQVIQATLASELINVHYKTSATRTNTKKHIDLDHLYFNAPFTETLDGEQFLAGAIDVDGKSLISTTLNNFRHLCRHQAYCYLDYLYTLHVAIGSSNETKRILPVVYCLMERKTKESYIAVFQKIKLHQFQNH
uniref:MULE transposase domain-containing protein n=1 Tax=Strigamia maritima TaxID=126957 RepID=T1J7J2_STRMM